MPSEPARPRIPLCTPNIAGNELAYVQECLESGWVSSVGSYVDRFEREFAAAVGAKHAVAVVNGTAALHVALHLAGVRAEDQVIVPALTFIATANAVRYCGAWPVFMDIEPEHLQIDVNAVARYLRDDCVPGPRGPIDRHTRRRVAAIVPVDLLGHPADLDAIEAIAAEHGIVVVEDATESLGANRRGRPVGSDSRLACFSFNGNKLVTTGGGGMIVTDDPALRRRAAYLTTQAKDDAVEFIHGEVGWNYRLTNVQAAIGCAQLERVRGFVARKRAIHSTYVDGLADLEGVRVVGEAWWARSAMWLSTIIIDPMFAGTTRQQLADALAADGIETRPLWQPLHLSPAHVGSPAAHCPVAERIQRTALSLPCSTHLTGADQDFVIDAVRRHIVGATVPTC